MSCTDHLEKTFNEDDLWQTDDLWQADLVEMGAFSKSNDGFRYLLTVIDTFSKYAWGEALKSKNANDVSQAIKRIFKSGHGTPRTCKLMMALNSLIPNLRY